MFKEKIYDCISYAVLEDGHKLVKVKALGFWDLIIKKELEYEGMIDGTFPSVTFSKVLKKIITFDDETVEKCLLRVLNRLNEIGGLNVLLYVFQNENDEELIEPAIKHITKIADMLIKYNIMSLHSYHPFNSTSRSNCCGETLPDEFLTEVLDLQTNTIVRHPNNIANFNQRKSTTGFLDFLRIFDNFCKVRSKKAGEKDDLNTVLNRIFVT